MITLRGRQIPGHGMASSSIPAQKPFLASYCEDLRRVYDGTINLELDVPVFIGHPDIQTDRFTWSDAYPAESFKLAAITFAVESNPDEWFEGWIYEAEFSPHRGNPFVVEILAGKIIFRSGDVFHIRIPSEKARVVSAVIIGK